MSHDPNVNAMTATELTTYERRLRHVARRHGFVLSKSATQNPAATGFGLFSISHTTNPEFSDTHGYTLNHDGVAKYLREDASEHR